MTETDSHKDAGGFRAAFSKRQAFTLVELLIVTSIIVLLLGITLPSARKSIRQARSTVCKSNLRDVFRSLDMYQTENNGWLPTVDGVSAFRSDEAWSAKLFANNPAGRGVLICPDDPWAAIMRNNLVLKRFDLGSNSSYGLNDFIVSSPDSYLANQGRFHPKRPGDTILLADMGPDTLTMVTTIDGVIRAPSRHFGRLVIDDGYRPGTPPEQDSEPWLAGRHLGKINVLTLAGNVKEVATGPVLEREIATYYPSCASQSCTICLDFELPHYSFAESQAFWWTGPLSVP